MSENTVTPPANAQESKAQVVVDSAVVPEGSSKSEEKILEFLREMQENVGQVSELSKEEENLVREFFNFLARILKPFSKTIEISTDSLPQKYREQVAKSHLYLNGQLVLAYKNGNVEMLNLIDQENHEVLTEIAGEIMLKLRILIASYKTATEKRVKFLMAITKELQKVAKVFSEQ